MKQAILSLIIILFSFLHHGCSSKEDIFFDSPGQITSEEEYSFLWDRFYLHLDAVDIDSALHYADSIKILSLEQQNKKWIAKSNKALGFILSEKAVSKEAIAHYLIAVKYFLEIGELKDLAGTYINLGSEFHKNQEYKTAISFYQKANEIYHYEGTWADKSLVYRGMAICYQKMEDLEKASLYLELAKEAAEKGKDYLSLGIIYNTWGNTKLEQENYNQAESFYLLALNLALNLADSINEKAPLKAVAIHNLGELNYIKGNFKEAKAWLEKAIAIKDDLNDPVRAQISYLFLAKVFIKEKKYNEAISTLEEGLQKITPETIDNSINESLTLISEALIKGNENTKPAQYQDFNKKLLTYNQKLLAYNQNVSETKERLETISQQQAIQDAIEKHSLNEQIAEYEKRNTYIQYAFLIPVFFLICAVISVYLSARRNKEYKKLYQNIEEVLNQKKSLRHLNKK